MYTYDNWVAVKFAFLIYAQLTVCHASQVQLMHALCVCLNL